MSPDIFDMINPLTLNKYVEFWINEYLPSFDLSTFGVGTDVLDAKIEMKDFGVIAGLPFVEVVLKYFECKVVWKCIEGDYVNKGTVVGIVTGANNKILMSEEIVLSILTRACSIASIANKISRKVKTKWNGQLFGDDKITPGFGIVEHYALYVGGFLSQKYGLSSSIIKDNHIHTNGNIEKSVKFMESHIGKLMKIKVKCKNLNEALEATRCKADLIILESVNVNDVKSISKQVKSINSSVLIAASGGIIESNILDYATDNVDIIFSSLFSQGYKCIDFSINTIKNISIPDNSDSHKISNIESKIENTIPDKIEIANLESNNKEKIVTKRKMEETKNMNVDKSLPDTIKVGELSDKLISPMKQTNKQPIVNNKGVNKFEPSQNKQRKMNPVGKTGPVMYNLQSVGSARLPGQPVRFETKGGHNNNVRANMDNQANFIRSMAASLVMSLQNNQPNNASFMHPNAMRFGGPLPPRVPFLNNVKSINCKSCNFQNQNNGNPFCQVCRQKLE